jgi:chromate transporter
MCGPTSLLSYGFARLRGRVAGALWMRVFERGMVPIAIGLIAASGFLLAAGAAEGWLPIAISAASTLFVWRTRRSPLWVLVGGRHAGRAVSALTRRPAVPSSVAKVGHLKLT